MAKRLGWLVVAALLAGCGGVRREAEKQIASGALQNAEALLVTALRDKPGDYEVRFLLGKVYMLEQRPEDATTVLEPLRTMSKWPPRIAQAYTETATSIERDAQGSVLADYYLQSTRYDPSTATAACDALLRVAVKRAPRGDFSPLIASAGAVSSDCRRKAIAQLMSEIENADPAEASGSDLEAIGKAGAGLGEETTADLARAVRKLASQAAETDRNRAAELLRAALRIDETISRDLETVVLRSSLIPSEPAAYSSQSDQKTQALFDLYAGSPAEATKRILMKIGRALDAYAVQYNRYPVVPDMYHLRSELSSYAPDLPWADGWGKEIEYISAKDSFSVRLVSGGGDNYIEYASRQLKIPAKGVTGTSSADIIWQDGRLVQYPGEGSAERVR